MTNTTINGISEVIKVAGCGSASWIFQYDNKESIELIIEWVLHITGLPIRLIFPQQVAKQIGQIGYGFHAEKYEARLVFGGLKFTTKYNAHSGLPINNSVNGISKFRAYNMELHQNGGKKIVWYWHNDLF